MTNAERNTVYFTGDAHLGSLYHSNPSRVEKKLVEWLRSIESSALAIYFMGDMFDYWFEYKYVIPKGYVRFLGQLARMADLGIELHMLAGNHDVWMRDYLTQEIGVQIHHTPIIVSLLGRTFRLSHGDREYRLQTMTQRVTYHIFRNRFLQMLYRGLHPGLTMGFALWLSHRNRKKHIHYDQQEHYTNQEKRLIEPHKEWLYGVTKQLSQQYPEVETFIYGHRHLMIREPLPGGKEFLITGDWIRHNSYASWNGNTLTLSSFHPSA